MLTTFKEFDSFLKITPEAALNCTTALNLTGCVVSHLSLDSIYFCPETVTGAKLRSFRKH